MSAASCAASRSPTSTTTSSTSSSATSCARAGAASCSSRPRARAAATSRRCPSGTSRSPTSTSRPAQWDALQIPVSVAFFFVNSTLDRVVRVLPEPGGRDRVAAPARHVGRAHGRATPSSATLLPDVEAFLVRVDRASDAGRVLPRPDRRVLRARRPAADRCGTASTAAARRTRRSTRSSTACGRRAR